MAACKLLLDDGAYLLLDDGQPLLLDSTDCDEDSAGDGDEPRYSIRDARRKRRRRIAIAVALMLGDDFAT